VGLYGPFNCLRESPNGERVKKELFGVFAGSNFADLDSKNIRHTPAKNNAKTVTPRGDVATGP